MSQKFFKLAVLFVLLGALALLTTACSISTTSSVTPSGTTADKDSSIFLSTDRGDTWRVTTAVSNANGRVQNINDVNVNLMTMDPSDSLAIYLASFDRGLFYTYNVTNGWNEVGGLPKATINDVKVDPKNKCNLYAAISNRVYRSVDCARSWTQVYFDNNTGVNVTTIGIDQYNPKNIYIGTSRGEIIKSIDSGESWRTIQRMEEGINRLIISPLDSRLIFIATAKNRIFSFTSNTNTNPANSEDVEANFIVEDWTDLNDILSEYNLGVSFKDLVVCQKDGAMFIATEKLILRSKDNGFGWENIKLIQPDKEAVINAIAVNPQNSSDLYYVTNTTFFRSSDGGTTWTTKKLPTKRAGRELLIDFDNPNVIYLGTIKLK
ncbi:MAG: hypothetical protein WC523_01060 [Patescibacteria group bacterium]